LPDLSRRSPQILLCSAWQTVNIGDIAHTPGALALLEKQFPDADVVLWAFKPLTPDVVTIFKRRFPRFRYVEGTVTPDGHASDPELDAAITSSDFLLHGSGPATLAWREAEAFTRRTGRPFGIYGVSYGLYGVLEKATLSRARFVYFRDSASLDAARRDGVAAPVMDFSPDTAFAFDLRDDKRANAFLAQHELEPRRFVCCLARLRHSPYWKIPAKNQPLDAEKHAHNEAMKEQDHRPLRDAITAVTRQTDLKVLICPEDETQMADTKTNLWDRLPADVQKRVVWRDTFWLPDEAASVYALSAGVFGSEQHSPILAIANSVAAVLCRSVEQSTKGIMWRDIGLGDWLFDLDEASDRDRIAPTVLAMAQDAIGSREKAERARDFTRRRFEETMNVVRHEVLAAAQQTGASS